MAPRFDPFTQRWYPSSPDEEPSAGYPPVGSLLRHGPKPYLERTLKPDEYEQAVLKFMAADECSRNEAQANMDAYLRNPNDWAFDRMEFKRRGYKIDYLTLKPKKIVLTSVWSAIVVSVVGRIIYAISMEESFYAFMNTT